MKLAMSNYILDRTYPEKESPKLLAENGFDVVDYSLSAMSYDDDVFNQSDI